MPMRVLCATVATGACLLAGPTATAAQGVSGLRATRGELEAHLQRLEQLVRSGTAGDQERSEARAGVALIRVRLAEGDFQVGDRIALVVEGDSWEPERTVAGVRSVEQQLSDTFAVGLGKELTLPVIGLVALRGVLRAELEAHLTRAIGRFIREPVVHSRPLIRLSVQGGVARPGYYLLPADAVLSDALMAAGGTTQDAKLAKLHIERTGKPIWEGELLRQAIAHGRTLDDMALRGGDQFVVPQRRRTGTESTLRIVGMVLSIPVTIYTLTRIF